MTGRAGNGGNGGGGGCSSECVTRNGFLEMGPRRVARVEAAAAAASRKLFCKFGVAKDKTFVVFCRIVSVVVSSVIVLDAKQNTTTEDDDAGDYVMANLTGF